jgi:hypothetical protein
LFHDVHALESASRVQVFTASPEQATDPSVHHAPQGKRARRKPSSMVECATGVAVPFANAMRFPSTTPHTDISIGSLASSFNTTLTLVPDASGSPAVPGTVLVCSLPASVS